jgi:VIT1/CCC1 family predicted Fe2+/Mn2+ transporter
MLGINDGLVTNVSLILGVAGAQVAAGTVRVAGVASLVAGACSMAVGEYISMRAQVELLERLLMDERAELQRHPEATRRQLQDFIEKAGVSPKTARAASRELARNPDHAVATYARSIGLDPAQLGSPWVAAFSSLVTFALGALLPLIPWFFTSGTVASLWSLGLAAGAAVAIGLVLGHIGARRPLRAALRQLVILALAAGTTHLVGRMLHAQVA